MNVLFLTMSQNVDIHSRGIYPDLLRKFVKEGHMVYIVSPKERRYGEKTGVRVDGPVTYLGVRTLNLQKSSVIEKGFGQILVESQFKNAICQYLKDISVDLVLYATPPITFEKVIKYLKQKNAHSRSYLLLKDIFPQNALDIGMISKTGLKGFIYRYFRKKEKKLYSLSDNIGCMSPANVEFITSNNPEIERERVEVAPNSIELVENEYEDWAIQKEREIIRKKYDLPTNIPIFIYGGNLGKPQGIDYLIECLDANKNREDCFFVVVGDGTEYNKLSSWVEEAAVLNKNICIKLIKELPKQDYDILLRSCEVGLIFLDHRFSIPNFPSRLLSYLENKKPVICATDANTDMGRIAEANGFGYWCESVSPEDFTVLVDRMLVADRNAMGERGYAFLKQNYLVENTYNAIMSHV